MPIPADASYYILGLLRQPDAPHARAYLGITGLGGAIKLSAGSTSQTLSALTIADSNGVSFGLDPVLSVLTATVGAFGGGLTNINVSAGITSQNLSKFVLSNSNNVSFGLNGSTITALATVASTQGSINLSAGTTSNLGASFTLADSNGLSFGLNAGTLTAAFSTLVFSNSNNLTFGIAGSTLTASAGTGAASFPRLDQVLDASSTRLFIQSTNNLGFRFDHVTTNATWDGAFMIEGGSNLRGDLVHIHHTDSDTVLRHLVHIEGNGPSETGLHISLSNGTSKILPLWCQGGTVGVSIDLTSQGQPLVLNSLATNSVQFLNADLLDGKHSSELTSAGGITAVAFSASNTSSMQTGLTFSNSNGVSFGLSNGTLTASISSVTGQSPVTISEFFPQPYLLNVLAGFSIQSTKTLIAPFLLPLNASFGFVRFPFSYTMVAPNTYSTSGAQTTYSFEHLFTTYALIYSLGIGASSNSLQLVNSCSAGMTISYQLSETGNTWSQGTSISFPITGSTSEFTSTFSSTRTNVSWQTTGLNNLTGIRYVDLPYSQSLSPGMYWMAVGVDSTTHTQGQSTLFSMLLGQSLIAMSQSNLNISNIGGGAQAIPTIQGYYTTNAIGTTASIDLANLNTTQAHPMIYWQGLCRS